jgi:large exoprotein involved in heme utilization and adhesion
LSSFSFSEYGASGKGGAISLEATNTIQVPNGSLINSIGALGSGNITIVSNAPFFLDNTVISSDTFGSGRGGDILISAPSISFINGAQVSASTHSSGQGGNITLVASDFVELSGATTEASSSIFYLFQNLGLAGIPDGTFLGGFIPTGDVPPRDDNNGFPQFPAGTLFPSGVFTQTTVGSTGSAGNLRIETGRLLIKDGAAIATTTFGQASAGNISVQAKDSISVDNGSILSGVAAGAIGSSGKIELQTRSLFVTGGGTVQTQTLGEGKAGDIWVNATDAVTINGVNPDTNIPSGLRSGSGGSNTLLVRFVGLKPLLHKQYGG